MRTRGCDRYPRHLGETRLRCRRGLRASFALGGILPRRRSRIVQRLIDGTIAHWLCVSMNCARHSASPLHNDPASGAYHARAELLDHRMTSSAVASSVSGKVRPRAEAAW
jgi:hypothetical protein